MHKRIELTLKMKLYFQIFKYMGSKVPVVWTSGSQIGGFCLVGIDRNCEIMLHVSWQTHIMCGLCKVVESAGGESFINRATLSSYPTSTVAVVDHSRVLYACAWAYVLQLETYLKNYGNMGNYEIKKFNLAIKENWGNLWR